MQFNHFQKNYIKRHIKYQTIGEIAQYLNLREEEITIYLGKQESRTPKITTNWFKKHWLNLSILTLIFIVTFANALNNVFLSDDLAEIVQNPNVGNFSYIFSHPFGFIRILLNYFAFHLGGLNPIFFRLINYGFHLGSIYLIYTLLALLYNKRVAFFTAIIFAIHPAIAEAVVWISGGTYPQYAFFFLLSFLLYILSAKKKFFYFLSSIFYLSCHILSCLWLFL